MKYNAKNNKVPYTIKYIELSLFLNMSIFDYTYKELNSCGVYKLTLLTTGDFYIGSTTRTFKERWSEIRHHLRSRHQGKISQRLIELWVTYGEDNFEFSIVEVTEKSIAKERELYWIRTLNPSLNILKNPITGEVNEEWYSFYNKKESDKYTKRYISQEEGISNYNKMVSTFKDSKFYYSLYIEPKNEILLEKEKLEPFTENRDKSKGIKIKYKLSTTTQTYYFFSLKRFLKENELKDLSFLTRNSNKYIWTLEKVS